MDTSSLFEKLGANLEVAIDASYELTYTDVVAHRKALAATKSGLLAEIAQLKAIDTSDDAPDQESDDGDTSNNLTKREWDAEMEKLKQDRLKMVEEQTPFNILGFQISWQYHSTKGILSHLILSRDLNIVSVNRPDCWIFTSVPETIYAVAEFIGGDLLDISCQIHTSKLTPGIEYTASFIFMFKSEEDEQLSGRLPHAEAYVGIAGEEKSITKVSLGSKPFPNLLQVDDDGLTQTGFEEADQYAEPFDDSWRKVELGDYVVKENEDVQLEIGLKSSIKKGLIIKGIEIKNRFV